MREKYKTRRFIFIFLTALGGLSIIVSLGFLATGLEWQGVLAISIWGVFFFLIGLAGLYSNRLSSRKDTSGLTRSEMRLSDIEIERMVDEAGVIDLEQFEKEKNIEYDFKYILILELPKNAICMISKTPIEKEESVLQCPNCQNYYLTKYLLGWLHKNSKCPICQFDLKTKKV